MSSNALTERQRAILLFVHGYKQVHQICPSLDEVGTSIGLVTSSVRQEVVFMRDMLGLLQMEGGKKGRTLRLSELGKKVVGEIMEELGNASIPHNGGVKEVSVARRGDRRRA